MLNHIIYTRCSAHRDLLNGGKQSDKEGHSVFSMNKELFTDGRLKNFTLLNNRLSLKNASIEGQPIGLFNSYEYNELGENLYALTFEFDRPMGTVPRANGSGHRAGNYVKECLIGEIEDYPYKWFGSPVWEAHLKSENDYYLDNKNVVVPWLNPVSEKCRAGKNKESEINNFIDEGRAAIVRSAVCYLIKEYEKPVEQRRPLLIKDTPENVEMWIASIERFFPAHLARKITFTTNKGKMSSPPDSSIFYYQDQNDNFMVMNNGRGKRIPYCMIVGYHPKDRFSMNIRQVAQSNFRIIDGVSLQTMIEPDPDANRPLFMDCSNRTNNADIYNKHFLPVLPVSNISMKLADLYEVYEYLFDERNTGNNWQYWDALKNLRCFNDILGGPRKCADFSENGWEIINQIFSNMQKQFEVNSALDQKNGYALLNMMWEYALPLHKEKTVSACVADLINSEIRDLPASAARLSTAWESLANLKSKVIMQNALQTVFGSTNLVRYYKMLDNMTSSDIAVLMDMYKEYRRITGRQIRVFKAESLDYQLVKKAVTVIMLKSGLKEARTLMEKSSDSQSMYNQMILDVARELQGSKDKHYEWWDMVLGSPKTSITGICKSISENKDVDIDYIENLLILYFRKTGGFNKDIEDAFGYAANYYGLKAGTGIKLFSTWIENMRPGESSSIIRTIQKMGLSRTAQNELFNVLDNSLINRTDVWGEQRICGRELNDWAGKLKKVSNSLALYQLISDFNISSRKKKRDLLMECIDEDYDFVIGPSFLKNAQFEKLSKSAAKEQDPEIHLLFMLLFDTKDDKALLQNYADVYVDNAANNYNRRTMDMLASIIEATTMSSKNIQREPGRVKETQKCMEKAVEKYINDNYQESMRTSAANLKYYSKPVMDTLMRYIDTAANDPRNQRKGNIFKQWFQRFQ